MAVTDDRLTWRGRMAIDRHGRSIGRILEIYVDRETNAAEWSIVQTASARSSFMPLAGCKTALANTVMSPFTRRQVMDAPVIGTDGQLSLEHGAELSAHYAEADPTGTGGVARWFALRRYLAKLPGSRSLRDENHLRDGRNPRAR
jgi:hypothetical protein